VARDVEKNYELVEPSPAAMIESMRAFGYTTATALSDIIDNSISARAKSVWLNFHWDGSRSYIAVLDDGCGMEEDVLKNAMRPGSQSRQEERDARDLGRFGLGLKTASFSQCRRLTVASRAKRGKTCTRMWDLGHVKQVDKWQLLKSPASGSEGILSDLDNLSSGTIVLWECLDRIVGDARVNDQAAHMQFLKLVDQVENHLAMVFHRYIEGTKPLLRIYMNDHDEERRVLPWDPFLESHPATTALPVECVRCEEGTVTVATPTLLVLIIGRVFYKEHLSTAAWSGCVVGALAVAALAYGG